MIELNCVDIDKPLSKKDNLLDKVSFVLIAFSICIIPLIVFPTGTTHIINEKTYLGYDLYYGAKTTAIYIIILSMLIVTLIKLRTEKLKLKLNKLFILFVLWSLVSTIMSNYRWTALTGWALRWQGSLTYVAYLVLFLFVLNFLQADKVKVLIKLLFASASIIAIYAIMQYYGLQPLKFVFGNLLDGRIHSTIGNRNFLGSYMVLLALTASFYFFKSNKPKNKIMFLLSVLFFAGLIASLTRVAWIGFLMAFVFNLWLMRGKLKIIYKKVILLVVSFAMVAFLLNITTQESVMARIFNMQSQVQAALEGDIYSAGSYRGYIYKRAFEIMLQKPVFGTGPDCLGYYTVLTKEENDKYFGGASLTCIDKVHSEYLEYAATMGIPSLLLYLGFLFTLFIPAVRRRFRFDSISTGVFAGWTGYLLQAAFNIGVISVLPVFFVYSAIIQKSLDTDGLEAMDKPLQ